MRPPRVTGQRTVVPIAAVRSGPGAAIGEVRKIPQPTVQAHSDEQQINVAG